MHMAFAALQTSPEHGAIMAVVITTAHMFQWPPCQPLVTAPCPRTAPLCSALTSGAVLAMQPAAQGPGTDYLQTVTPNQFHLILRVYYGSPEVTGNSYVPPAVVPQ